MAEYSENYTSTSDSWADREDLSNDIEGILHFPFDFQNESANWVIFTRYSYSRPNSSSAPTPNAAGSPIALPIPNNLATSYGAQWNNTELGMVGRAIGEVTGGAVSKLKNSGLNSAAMTDALKSLVVEGLQATPNVAAAFTIDRMMKSSESALHYAGIARNPFNAFIYNGPEFRTFPFNYKLIPKNKKEAVMIQSIIKEFKLAQAASFNPTSKNNLFEYPDIFDIRLTQATENNLFKIGQCALRDMSVNYHGEGMPAYFNEKIPFSIELSLTFQEIQIVMREDIEKGF